MLTDEHWLLTDKKSDVCPWLFPCTPGGCVPLNFNLYCRVCALDCPPRLQSVCPWLFLCTVMKTVCHCLSPSTAGCVPLSVLPVLQDLLPWLSPCTAGCVTQAVSLYCRVCAHGSLLYCRVYAADSLPIMGCVPLVLPYTAECWALTVPLYCRACVPACPQETAPVCGSDGLTYTRQVDTNHSYKLYLKFPQTYLFTL